ncbi:SPOR domain-containing protein [Aquiflexum sp.]|uniref:SPOR domain-containing protein n=1 Tax=Aquiflexum sp. TaxID=1872584 RepID=UPI003593724C
MTEKENESKPNLEDKDYGFPFVEVTPIQAPVIAEKKEKSDRVEGSVKDHNKINPASSIAEIPTPASPLAKINKKVSRRGKSQVPLLFSLVFLIVIILGSIAYFLYYLPESENTLETTNPVVSQEMIAEEPLADGDQHLSTEMGELEDVGTITEAESETPVIAATPEVVTAEIIEVDRRGEIPYYNVIVASSPNKRIARAEAKKMIDKGRTTWIIFPFGNTNSYRISVGRYEDLESATKAMEKVRVEINESSWILKY